MPAAGLEDSRLIHTARSFGQQGGCTGSITTLLCKATHRCSRMHSSKSMRGISRLARLPPCGGFPTASSCTAIAPEWARRDLDMTLSKPAARRANRSDRWPCHQEYEYPIVATSAHWGHAIVEACCLVDKRKLMRTSRPRRLCPWWHVFCSNTATI
jgi:hypothetical protein